MSEYEKNVAKALETMTTKIDEPITTADIKKFVKTITKEKEYEY